MNYYEIIQRSINYIEENLNSVISLNDLSDNSYLSPYHFHRLFKALVGETPMDYVRKRRISSAALMIMNTNRKLIDIADEFNFSSQDVFSRAFHRLYGITPGAFRKQTPQIELFDKKQVDALFRPIASAMTYECKIVVKSSFKVVGLECTVSRAELSMDILNEDKWSDHEIRKNHDLFFGSLQWLVKNKVTTSDCIAIYKRNEDHTLTDLACVEVSDFSDIPESMVCRTLPSHKYAMFEFQANKAAEHITVFDLSDIMDYIYGTWLPSSGYSLADAASLEIWLPTDTPQSQCKANIYIPIM